MGLHRNARLGLAGRRALVADVEGGMSCRAAARGRGVSPTTACKWWPALVGGDARAAVVAVMSGGSFVAAAFIAAALAAVGAGAHLCGQAPLRLGAAAHRRRDRSSARDGLEGAQAGRDLAAAAAASRAAALGRVALSR
jgi:hypothetical protein